MSTPSRWSSLRDPRAAIVSPLTPRFGIIPPRTGTKTQDAPSDPPVPVEVKPAPPVEPPDADTPPVPIPANMKPGRRRNIKPKNKRNVTTTARTFTFPVDLLARLGRFGVGQSERTGQRFNYSAYLTLILDADLTKRGF